MNVDDDRLQQDPELEGRLRRIGAARPEAPASLYRYLRHVAGGGRMVNGVQVEPLRPLGRRVLGHRQTGILAGIAAALVIALSVAGLLVSTRGGPSAAATWTLRTDVGSGQWTGLEWHDITAAAAGLRASKSMYGGGPGRVVAWRGGFATLGGDFRIWLSKDGLTWSRAGTGPQWGQMVPVGSQQDLLVNGVGSDGVSVGLWRTSDGTAWTQLAVPFDPASSIALTAGEGGDLAVATVQDLSAVRGLSTIWLTTDGSAWTQASPPADMAAALQVTVVRLFGGFVAFGLLPDPKGSVGFGNEAGQMSYYSYHSWFSQDGLHWSGFDSRTPYTAGSSGGEEWSQMQSGRLGTGDGIVYSTDGGANWLADHDRLANLLSGYQAVSDGTRIVMAAGDASRFYLSEGDGSWTELRQGGDVGSLGADGYLALLPDGLLWITPDRVYFGQALSGTQPRGSIGPPTTASPGPSYGFATSTPAIVETATSELPTATPAPTATALAWSTLTTSGALSGWTGFSWAGNQQPRDNQIGKVVKWRGGYAAIDSSSNPGQRLWTSPDGETWNPVRSIPGPWLFVSAGPAGLVVLSVDYGARAAPDQATPTSAPYSATVWTSADGVTWKTAGTPDLPGPVISIAGGDAGIVATASPVGSGALVAANPQVEFSTDGVHWTPEAVAPGAQWIAAPMVESNGHRFFLMGGTSNALATGGRPGIVLAASVQHSYAWWSDDGTNWTRSGGGILGYGRSISFGRNGMLMTTDFGSVPGGTGLAVSIDGGKTWAPDDGYGPLGTAQCTGECTTEADGVIGGNGTVFVAVKNGGKQAWLSYDGRKWTPTTWAGGDPSAASQNGFGGFTVLPRGVLLTGVYGAAK